MPDPRTQIVSEGYDAIGDVFAEWRTRIVGDPRDEWQEELVARLEDGGRVLELGCGGGSPETERLARRFRLTGVDISPRQVERARAAIPGAEFVCADFTELELPAGSFDAVASFYAFNHVPRDLLQPLLERIHGWLVPGGRLLSAFGVSDLEGWTGEWLGAETFFSSYPAETNSRLVRKAGFAIERDEVVTFEEPEGPARFQWVLARSRSFASLGGERNSAGRKARFPAHSVQFSASDSLDERATSCARARQRPARAQFGLRLSPAPRRLSLRPLAPLRVKRFEAQRREGGGVTVRYDAVGLASVRAAGPRARDGSAARAMPQPPCAFSTEQTGDRALPFAQFLDPASETEGLASLL